MIDRDKVIKGLHDISGFIAGRVEFERAWNFMWTIDDAISLIKNQEAVEPFHRCIGKDFSIILIENSHFDYCPYCGKPITWAKQEGR